MAENCSWSKTLCHPLYTFCKHFSGFYVYKLCRKDDKMCRKDDKMCRKNDKMCKKAKIRNAYGDQGEFIPHDGHHRIFDIGYVRRTVSLNYQTARKSLRSPLFLRLRNLYLSTACGMVIFWGWGDTGGRGVGRDHRYQNYERSIVSHNCTRCTAL